MDDDSAEPLSAEEVVEYLALSHVGDPWHVGHLCSACVNWKRRPTQPLDDSAEPLSRLQAIFEALNEWDMLTLDDAGHGLSTADAPWARQLINDGFNAINALTARVTELRGGTGRRVEHAVGTSAALQLGAGTHESR